MLKSKESLTLEIDRSSYIDPNGYLFWNNGKPYRAINDSQKDFYLTLFENETIPDLVKSGKLVKTNISSFEHQDISAKLILEHEGIFPQTYCTEWCPSMLRQAALTTLDLCLELAEKDYMLQDAYPWNILFRGPCPVYVDVTSIVPVDPRLIWPAYSQFLSFFLWPLQLAALGKSRIARLLLMDNLQGISLPEFMTHLSASFMLTHPSLWISKYFNNFINTHKSFKEKIESQISEKAVEIPKALRIRFFLKLRQKIEKFSFAQHTDVWANYYKEIPVSCNKGQKVGYVREILQKIKPTSVVDLGCNTGVFSILAAQEGAQVIAVDSSESCIESLFLHAKKNDLNILPLVSDVLCPVPPYGFMGEQYKGLYDRIASHTVLCLGLMHHLHLSGRQSFDRIAFMLSKIAQKNIVFEYVDMKDDNNLLISSFREINYRIETVLEALGKYFGDLQVYPSDRETRRIILGSKR